MAARAVRVEPKVEHQCLDVTRSAKFSFEARDKMVKQTRRRQLVTFNVKYCIITNSTFQFLASTLLNKASWTQRIGRYETDDPTL